MEQSGRCGLQSQRWVCGVSKAQRLSGGVCGVSGVSEAKCVRGAGGSAGGCARKLEACARDLKEKESGLLGSPGEAN